MTAKGRELWPILVVLVATAIGAALRLAGADQSLFGDESSTLTAATAAGSPFDVIDLIRADKTVVELTPPLSFVGSWIGARVGSSPEWIRAPSLLCGVLMIPAVYTLGMRTVGRLPAMVAAGLVALSPFLIFYSQEARSYLPSAFAVVLSSIALVVALERGRLLWWAAYALASAAGMYTSYTTAFPLLAQFCWALWAYPDRRRAVLAANATAAVAFLPWLGEFFDDGGSSFNFLPYVHPLTLENVSSDLVSWTIGSPLVGRAAVPGTAGWVLIAAASAVGVGGLWSGHPRRAFPKCGPKPRAGLYLVLALAAACPLGLIAWSLLGTTILDARNLTPSAPALLLALAALVCTPPPAWRVGAIGALLVGFALGGLATLDDANQRPQFHSAAEFALDQLDPGDPIYAVENATYGGLEGPVQRYLRPYVADSELREAAEDPPGRLQSGADRVALISWQAGVLPGVVTADTAPRIGEDYTEVASQTFDGFVDVEVKVFARSG